MFSGSMLHFPIHLFSSITQSCPTLSDPMDCSTPGLPVHHWLPEFTQTHVHWVSDAIKPPHLLYKSPIIYLLTWGVWFVLNSNLLVSLYFYFFPQNTYISWLLPYLFRAVPQSYLRGCFPGLSSQQVCLIKLNSNPPVMQETRVQILGQEDNLEKEMATHSSILAWRILWTEEPGRLQSMRLQGLDTT